MCVCVYVSQPLSQYIYHRHVTFFVHVCYFADGRIPGDSDRDGDSGSDSGLHLP